MVKYNTPYLILTFLIRKNPMEYANKIINIPILKKLPIENITCKLVIPLINLPIPFVSI